LGNPKAANYKEEILYHVFIKRQETRRRSKIELTIKGRVYGKDLIISISAPNALQNLF